MGLDCHAETEDLDPENAACAHTEFSALVAEVDHLHSSPDGLSFRLGAFTQKLENATGFDVRYHMNTHMESEDVAMICAALKDDCNDDPALLQMKRYFDICNKYGIRVFLL